MVEFDYLEHTFEVDPQNLADWRVAKFIMKIQKGKDPDFFDTVAAISGVFGNKDDEYAEILDNDLEKMAGLLVAAVEAIGKSEEEEAEEPKN